MARKLVAMTEAPKCALLTAAREKIEPAQNPRATGLVGWWVALFILFECEVKLTMHSALLLIMRPAKYVFGATLLDLVRVTLFSEDAPIC